MMEERVLSRPARTAEPPSEEPDMCLVQAARQDPRAFGALYDRYMETIYRYLYRQTGSREAAEDLTSLTFMRALTALQRVDPRRPFSPWLVRIAHNALIDYRRAAGRTVPLSEDIVSGLVAQADQDRDSTLEQAEAFLTFTAHLTQDQRDALALRFIADLSLEQTAAALERSVGATKMLLSRALAALRGRFS